MSGSELLGPLGWANSPLVLLNAPARRLRASALAPGRLRREIEAWHAELAELAGLEAPWLWEEGDPFGGLPTSDRAPEPATPQPESRASAAPVATGDTRVGRRRAASERLELAAPEDARESWFQSLHPSPDFPSGQGGEGRSPVSAASLATWAARRGTPWLAAAACTPVGQPRGSAESLYRRALAKAFEDGSLTAPPTGRDGVPKPEEAPAHPLHRVPGPLAALSGDRSAAREAALETATGEQERARSSFPSAAGLLSRLTDRWFAVHPGPGAHHQPHAPGEAALGPRDAGVTAVEPHGQPGSDQGAPGSSPSLPLPSRGPVQPGLAPDRGQAVALEGDGHTAHMRWITPIAHNTIHLTVQSPPLADALDPDDLAELLDRILRQEARRYGISL